MPVLTRYLTLEMIKLHLLCAFILSLIFGVFAFIVQLESVDGHSYRILDAVLYVGMTVPERFVELSPFIALFGALFTMGTLSRHSEIVGIFSAGHGFGYLAGTSLIATMPLIITVVVASQWLAPTLYQNAELYKAARVSGSTVPAQDQGFWVRRDEGVLNIKAFDAMSSPQGILLYELDEQQRLASQLRATSAELAEDGKWHLTGVVQRRLQPKTAKQIASEKQFWQPLIEHAKSDRDTLPSVGLSPKQLLEKHAQVTAQGMSGRAFLLLFWQRLLLPYTLIGMLFLAIAFMLTSPKMERLGRQVLACAGLGVFCFLLPQILSVASMFSEIHPIFIGMLPGSALILLAGLWCYHKRAGFS